MKSATLWFILLANVCVWGDSPSGEVLFEQKCMVCHMKEKPSAGTQANMLAPPAMGVMFHLKKAFANNKKETLAFMQDYVITPTPEKAKCQPQAVKRFGIMPSMKDTITPEELVLVTEYMYAAFPPAGFEHKR